MKYYIVFLNADSAGKAWATLRGLTYQAKNKISWKSKSSAYRWLRVNKASAAFALKNGLTPFIVEENND